MTARLPSDVVKLSIDEVWEARARFLPALHPLEAETFASLALEKRRRDWLAGRIALKRAIQKRMGLPFSMLEIRASTEGVARGRPSLFIGGACLERLHLSLSHSQDLAVATLDEEPVGIDIELVGPRDRSFGELFLGAAEQAALASLPEDAKDIATTEAWCLKEAVAKWQGTGLRVPFAQLEVPPGVRVERGTFLHSGRTMCWVRVTGRSEARR